MIRAGVYADYLVSGGLALVLLLVFAVMPWLIGRNRIASAK